MCQNSLPSMLYKDVQRKAIEAVSEMGQHEYWPAAQPLSPDQDV